MTLEKDITILIVDDNVDFHTVATAVLARNGYQVISLYQGEFENILAAARNCDILLLDVDLPSACGTNISRQLKSNQQVHDLPIILISGNADLEILCMEAAADGYLGKPFSGIQLINEVERLLELVI
jgi:DNA-binding response OmpR family regulator